MMSLVRGVYHQAPSTQTISPQARAREGGSQRHLMNEGCRLGIVQLCSMVQQLFMSFFCLGTKAK